MTVIALLLRSQRPLSAFPCPLLLLVSSCLLLRNLSTPTPATRKDRTGNPLPLLQRSNGFQISCFTRISARRNVGFGHLVTESRLFASVNPYACTYEAPCVRVHVHGKALWECQRATAPVQPMLVVVAAATHCTFKGVSQNRCVSAPPPTWDRENRAPIDRRAFAPTKDKTERTGGGRKRHTRGTARVISRCVENRSVREGLSF